jgi:hypothetical protein
MNIAITVGEYVCSSVKSLFILFLKIRKVEDRGQAQEVDGDVAYPS